MSSRRRLYSSESAGSLSQLSVGSDFPREDSLAQPSTDEVSHAGGSRTKSLGTLQFLNKSAVDLKVLTQQMGYVDARTHIRKVQLQERLAELKLKEDETVVVREKQRITEMIRLSNALGAPGQEQPIDKIIGATNRNFPRPVGTSDDEYAHLLDNDIAIRRAILSRDLSIPQAGLLTVPQGLGDTLFLQLSYLTSMIMPRNKLTDILSHTMPQLSMTHYRYLTELNLSGNRSFYHSYSHIHDIYFVLPFIFSLSHLLTLDMRKACLSSH